MAVQLLGPAIKALAGGVKNAATSAVTGKAKDFVTGKNRKGKGGALVKSSEGDEGQVGGGTIVPTTPMVGSYRVQTAPDKPDELGKPSKISYESINKQLDSIIGLTNVLKKTSAAKLKNTENRRKAERKAAERAKMRQRESLLEKGAGVVGGIAGDLYGKVTEGFDPIKFFTMIFLGNLVKWFNENGSKISAPLRAGLALINNAAKVIRAALKALGRAFKGAVKLIFKLPKAILSLGKSIGKGIFNVGKKLGSAFIRLGGRLKNFIKGLLGRLRVPGFPRQPPRIPKAPKTPRTPRTPKAPTPKGRTPSGNRQVPLRAQNPRLQKPPATRPPAARVGGPANSFLKNLFGIKKPQEIQSLRRASPVLKKAGKFMKGARIPVVGPMIVFALTALDPNPETGGIGRAAFKAIGAGLGEFLGFGIPIPVLGPIIGGLVGEVMGDAAYELIVNKNPAAAGQKIMDAVTATGKFFGPILEWGKGVVTRFFDAIPKIKIPEIPGWLKRADFLGWLQKIPIWGQEIIDPKMFTAAALLELPQMFMKAFFGTSDEKGKVEKAGSKKMMTEQEYYNARVEDHGLPDTYAEYKSQFAGQKTPLISGASNGSGLSGNQKAFLETVSFAEGTKQRGYNTWFGNQLYPKDQPDLSQYTINEIVELQNRFLAEGLGKFAGGDSAAVGKYQMIYPETFAAKAGLNPAKDKFTPGNQDKMALFGYIMGQGGVTEAEINASEISDQTIDKLAPVFASFPNLFGPGDKGKPPGDGVSYYANQGAKYKADIKAQFRKERGGGSQPVQQQSVQPQAPLAGPQKRTYAILCYGTNDFSLSEGQIKTNATAMIGNLKSKGYIVVVVPPNKDLVVQGTKRPAPYKGVHSAASDAGVIIELGKYSTEDPLHLELSDAKRIHNKYKPAIYVGDSNAVRIKGATGAGFADTDTAVVGASGVDIKNQINSVQQLTPMVADPGNVTPSPQVQSQRSNEIADVSQQLSYETGNTVVMVQDSNGQQIPMISGGGKGTPVIMGSGDVVNSYYKTQFLGFLYKQG